MKKVKSNVKIIALTAAVSAVMIGAGYQYMTNASESQVVSENSIELNVEKQDKDTIKIYLSNFSDLAKSLQLSVKIEEGNVKFNEDSINWLINEENVQKNYKIDDDKKVIDFFIVSNEAINSDNGTIEICEIDVAKEESIADILFKNNDKGYKVVPNVTDGEAYSYITYASNKKVSGEDIVNASDELLTINSNPIIRFKESSSIVENKIIISKGSVFKINDYVEAYDCEGNEILDIEYSGKIDNKNIGSYNIICKATDSYGDSSILEITVIVEEVLSGEIARPIIQGADKPLEIIIGKEFDLEDGIKALDYMGRVLDITISGDYDVNKAGTYIITYSATDRFNNVVTVERTLIVKEQNNDSSTEDSSSSSSGNSYNSSSNSSSIDDIVDADEVISDGNTNINDTPVIWQGENSNDYKDENNNISKVTEERLDKPESVNESTNKIFKDKATEIVEQIKSTNSKEDEEIEEVQEIAEAGIDEEDYETTEASIDNENSKEDTKDNDNIDVISEEKSSNNILTGVIITIIAAVIAGTGIYFKKKK